MTATHPYAQFLGDRDPLAVLAETQEKIPAIAQKLGAEGLQRSYGPGKWTGAQVLAHLADCEIAFGHRVRQIVAEPALPIQPFDENLWAKHYDRVDGAQAAQTFKAVRGWNLALFRRLTREELERASQHPVRGPEKAATVIRILAGHTLNHLGQLEKIVAGSAAA
ncbi:MAG TPA: DinB family protein [Terriglobales bacterium]|nr:DinB family protein [Terriglobales bacterium]